jgi:hypothetical protein
MKMNRLLNLAAVLFVLTLVPLASSFASSEMARVQIPFDFAVDGEVMPAGEYVIARPSEKVISLRRIGGTETKASIANPAYSSSWDGKARIIFNRYGNEYFVSTIWLTQSDHGFQFLTSATEMKLARDEGERRAVDISASR